MIITAQKPYEGQYKTCSRWIKVKDKEVTPRHKLYDYSDNGSLLYFMHNNREYAIGQFERLAYPIMWNDNDGKLQYISGYDCTTWYNPYLIEIESNGEYVRLWTQVTSD